MHILDVEKWDRDDINSKLVTKIKLLKDAARAEIYANTVANTEKQIGDIASGAGMDSETAQKYVSYYVKNGKSRELLERKIVADYIAAGKAMSDGPAHSLSKSIISIGKLNPQMAPDWIWLAPLNANLPWLSPITDSWTRFVFYPAFLSPVCQFEV